MIEGPTPLYVFTLVWIASDNERYEIVRNG
jgi:hypothetical protein